MKCTHIKELLPLYAGGDLPVQQADLVRAHLLACQQCNDLAIGFGESSVWLDSEGKVAFDDQFFEELRDSVWRSVRTEQMERPQGRWSHAWVLLFASAAAIAILAMMPLLRSKDVTTPAKVEVAIETKAPEVVSTVADASSATLPAKRYIHRPALHRIASAAPAVKTELPAGSESSGAVREEAAPSTDFIRRIEIQTSDPSIRIIWLVREPAAPVPTQAETED